jgi:hypothetical protein
MRLTMGSQHSKPDALICPREYCFHWVAPGGDFAPGLSDDLDSALGRAVPSDTGRCSCTFGACVRSEPAGQNRDWYEPHEPNLLAAGLPWFYFIPDPYGIVSRLRKRYVRESELLWGKRHWEQ